MKDIKNIIADLQAWVEEDTENRAIALVTVQKTEETEKKYTSEQNIATNGITGLLVDAFGNVLNDKDPENGLHKVLRIALRRQAIDGLVKIAERVFKDKDDKKPENGSEDGKEADHE